MKRIRIAAFLFLFLCSLAKLSAKESSTGVVAHRGYWKTEGAAQNSLASLQKAIDVGCEGSECDVYLTKDGAVVLFHDQNVQGRPIERMEYAETQRHRLSNGETMPLLSAYLAVAARQHHTKPIIELKAHTTPELENRLVDSVLGLVALANMERQVEYISFSRNICERIIAKEPKAKVSYLNGELAPSELKALGYTGLDYHLSVMRKNETWFDEAKRLGLEVNVWTANDSTSLQWLLDKKIRYITTDEPALLQDLRKK